MKNLSGVVAIAVGSDRSLALRNNGTVWGSGCQEYDAAENCSNVP